MPVSPLMSAYLAGTGRALLLGGEVVRVSDVVHSIAIISVPKSAAMPEEVDKPTISPISESIWKPLGRGYDQFHDFFLQYCSSSDASNSNPDLAISLNTFAASQAESLIRDVG